MAAGVELRCPFMDHRLFEWLFGLEEPLRAKITEEKWILKEIMQNKLPEMTLCRQKQGFGAPALMTHGLRQSEFIHEVLSPERIRDLGLFDPDFVREHLPIFAKRYNPAVREEAFIRQLMNRIVSIQFLHYTFVEF